MKATKLSPKQREVFQALKEAPNGVLRQHIKPNNSVCFRLLDYKKNPIANYRMGIVLTLADKNLIELTPNGDYILKATIDE